MKPRGAGENQPSQVTILDIAARAGVSVSTVSRVLNKTVPVARAKREAVLGAVEVLGYRPNVVAQELARGRSLAVGVLPQGIWNPFYSRLLKGVEQGLRGTAFHPMYASGEQPVEEAQAFELLLANRVEALILMGGQIADEKLVLLSQRLPIVAIGRNVAGLEHRCVRVENAEGGYNATRHLVDLGHRRIVHITGLSWHARRDRAPAGLRARAGRSRPARRSQPGRGGRLGRAVRADRSGAAARGQDALHRDLLRERPDRVRRRPGSLPRRPAGRPRRLDRRASTISRAPPSAARR